MKKIIVLIILILIVGFGIFYFATDTLKPTEMLNGLEISKLANESYLDILVDMVEYDANNIEEYKLLEAAMRIARELDLVKTKTEPVYLEYVPRDTVHAIIEELTGIKIEQPIREEDFYYLYDDENDYYYIVPVGTDWIHYGKILYTNKQGNSYVIDCTGVRSDYNGGEEEVYVHMKIKLHKRNDYKYIKYRLESISYGEKVLRDETSEMHEYGSDNAVIKYYSFVPQDFDKTIVLTFTTQTVQDENRESSLSMADKLADYYKKNSEAYRNTRVFIVPCTYTHLDVLKDFVSNLDVDSVIEFQISNNNMIGDESLAEIFEEEMNLPYSGNFEANVDSTLASFISFATWAHENGEEALLVEFANDYISFDNLVNTLDKII